MTLTWAVRTCVYIVSYYIMNALELITCNMRFNGKVIFNQHRTWNSWWLCMYVFVAWWQHFATRSLINHSTTNNSNYRAHVICLPSTHTHTHTHARTHARTHMQRLTSVVTMSCHTPPCSCRYSMQLHRVPFIHLSSFGGKHSHFLCFCTFCAGCTS